MPFENIVGKGEKCWLPPFSPLSTIISTLWKTSLMFQVTFKMLSAFNLDKDKILLSGKVLSVKSKLKKCS